MDSGCFCQLDLGDTDIDIHSGQVEASITEEQLLLAPGDAPVSFSWSGCSISNSTKCSYRCCHGSCTNLNVDIAFAIGGHSYTNDQAQAIEEEAMLEDETSSNIPQAFTAAPGVQSYTASPGVVAFTASPDAVSYTASPGIESSTSEEEEATQTLHSTSSPNVQVTVATPENTAIVAGLNDITSSSSTWSVVNCLLLVVVVVSCI